MKNVTRRGFIGKSIAIGAGAFVAPSILKIESTQASPNILNANKSALIGKNDISLAQWALVGEIGNGDWKTLDFPRIAKEDFGLNRSEERRVGREWRSSWSPCD